MKVTSFYSNVLSCVPALVLLGAIANTHAQTSNFTVDNFDTDTSASWTRWWGSATQDYAWDPSVDAKNNTGSGSLKATIGFDTASYAGDNQFALQSYFQDANASRVTLDGAQYTNLVFDVRFDPSSAKRSNGDFGFFEYGIIPSDYSQIELGSLTATNSNWIHVAAAIDPSLPKLGAIIGVWFKVWAGDTGAGALNALTGTTVFWLDNVQLLANTNAAVKPPSLSIQAATPGLNLTASNPGSQYQRQNIRTQNTTGYSWVNSASPVTYSFDVVKYPDSTYSGFQTQLFLAPGSSIPNYETSVDWNEPSIIFLDLENHADGTATATFRYKVNEANGNTMIYNSNSTNGPVGTLASVNNPTPLGKWSLSFSNNTSVTLTAPSGTSTNFTLPSDAAAQFADPLYVYLGVQPNNLGSIGQSAAFSNFSITSGTGANPTSILSDNFAKDTSLDTTNMWQIVAEDANGVSVVPPDAKYLVKWTTPASGFALQTSSTLAPGSWKDAESTYNLAPARQVYKSIQAVIPQGVPGAKYGFFRLATTNAPAGQ